MKTTVFNALNQSLPVKRLAPFVALVAALLILLALGARSMSAFKSPLSVVNGMSRTGGYAPAPSAGLGGDQAALASQITAMQADANGFVKRWFDANGFEYRKADVSVVVSGASSQPCEAALGHEFIVVSLYCSGNSTSLFYVDVMMQASANVGGAIVAQSVGHEIGHHIQALRGLGASEQQADCISGAWIADAINRGAIRITKEGLIAMTSKIGADGFGTGSERSVNVANGFNGGLIACGVK